MDLLQNRENIYSYLLEILRKYDNKLNLITDLKTISGGSINDAYQITTNRDSYFLKINSANEYPAMFDAEALGLNILARTHTFKIPEVIDTITWENKSGLILSFIKSAEAGSDFSYEFAHKLAALHSNTSHNFGLNHSNYIGSLVQENTFRKSWQEFYSEFRIEPLFRIAYNAGKLSLGSERKLSRLMLKLDQLLPIEKPALLHGDLWSGNYMIDEMGKAVLVDPAVYYGHREMDLAMMKLFGGFSADIFKHYNEVFPLEGNWEERIDIHQLYPLLVHVILFGGAYIYQFNSVIADYS